ncbi:uncharacterized protein I303_101901 [Kwoniella dejecticola CBS 10117]|uniref:Ubiquitin-like protease family profile domain-containing protein n=1 Tax=Kwoniella dejecticola CBS 10117 TaxID=1296121 RepID=A0A1A6ACG7_9TREE|nr:uncharacterized protein I303_01963 [Kwoniella dejecticola CBS 10117]OBR87751.1 hypothetical protein I303_01963 [Kwoniella dejecticola CBS 10117]
MYAESEDDEAPAVISKPKPSASSQFKGDRNDVLFPFPTTGRAEVTITVGDAQRIETGEFLNDTLLEFGLRKVLYELQAETRATTHLFNSFFYERLSDRTKRPEKGQEYWPGYESVRKWSKGINIFEKQFIVVPINEHFHWYLAVIVNPGGMLRSEHGQGASSSAAITQETVVQALAQVDAGDASSVDEQLSTREPRIYADLDELDSEREDAKSNKDATSPPLSRSPPLFEISTDRSKSSVALVVEPGDVSMDPLDCIGVDEVTVCQDFPAKEALREVSTGVEKMDINSDNEDEVDLVGEGGPIVTPTLTAMAQQERLIQDASSGKPVASTTQGRKRPPDAEIAGSDDTWIITFDSLGGPHKTVGTQLTAWLQYEAKDKMKVECDPSEVHYWEGKVPQQDNFYDCGIFVVHYAKQLLQKPQEILKFIQRRSPYSNDHDRADWLKEQKTLWNAEDTISLRTTWEGELHSLAEQYRRYKASQPQSPADESQDMDQDDEHPMQDVEERPAMVADSQPESIRLLPGANGSSAIPQEDHRSLSIPGAFPTHSTHEVTAQPSVWTHNGTRPKWSTTPSEDGRRRRRSSTMDMDPNIKPSRQSSPLSPAPPLDNVPRRSFATSPVKAHHVSPSLRSIDVGVVQKRKNGYESSNVEIEGPITRQRASSSQSPAKPQRTAQGREKALREVEHLRPNRRILGEKELQSAMEIDEPASTSSSWTSTAVQALGPEPSSSETEPSFPVSYANATSPFLDLGRGAPGSRSHLASDSPNQQQSRDISRKLPESVGGADGPQPIQDSKHDVFHSITANRPAHSSPSQMTGRPRLSMGSEHSANLSDEMEEEEEQIEHLPPSASKSNVKSRSRATFGQVTPKPTVKHQYGATSAAKRARMSTGNAQAELPVAKRGKTGNERLNANAMPNAKSSANPSANASAKAKKTTGNSNKAKDKRKSDINVNKDGNGTSREEAITVDLDSDSD